MNSDLGSNEFHCRWSHIFTVLVVLVVLVVVAGKEHDPESWYHRFQITEAKLLHDPADDEGPTGLLVQLDDGFGPTCIFSDAEAQSGAFPECSGPDACICQSISGLPIKSWSPLIVIGSMKTCCEGRGPRKKKRFLNIADKKRVLAKVLDRAKTGEQKDTSELTATWQLINPQTVLVTIRNHAEPPRVLPDSDSGKEEPWSEAVCLISGDGLEHGFESLIKKGRYKECYKAVNFIVKGGKPSLWTQDDVQAKIKENLGVKVVWRSGKAKSKPTSSPKTEL